MAVARRFPDKDESHVRGDHQEAQGRPSLTLANPFIELEIEIAYCAQVPRAQASRWHPLQGCVQSHETAGDRARSPTGPDLHQSTSIRPGTRAAHRVSQSTPRDRRPTERARGPLPLTDRSQDQPE